jgi:hypothetical protein
MEVFTSQVLLHPCIEAVFNNYNFTFKKMIKRIAGIDI